MCFQLALEFTSIEMVELSLALDAQTKNLSIRRDAATQNRDKREFTDRLERLRIIKLKLNQADRRIAA